MKQEIEALNRTSADIHVIIPAYNAERYVAEAVRSVQAQTVRCRKILVVDDGSTDGTAALLEQQFPEVTLIRKSHSGTADTLNCGLLRISSEFVAFLDADDRWMPRKTEIQLAALQADPDLSMVFGHARRFIMTAEGERVIDVLPGATKVGGLFRSDAFRRVGTFDIEDADFIDWFARARDIGLIFRIDPEVVFERRIHDTNVGVLRRDAQRKGYHQALKMALERRRSR
jgi:glycosyltransferase involved in cell wall biosynthesis